MRFAPKPMTSIRSGGWIASLILVLLLVLIAPNFLIVRSAADILETSCMENMAYAACFWALVFALVPRLWMGLAVAMACSLWWPLEVFLRVNFAQPVTPTFVGMAMDADTREISEFLSTSGWTALLPVVLFISVAIGLGMHLYRQRTRWTHRSRHWVLLTVSPILVLLVMSHRDTGDIAIAPEPFVNRAGNMAAVFASVYPLDLPLSAIEVYRDASIIRQLRARLSSFGFMPQLADAHPDTVVLVIGESSRPDRWQLFGYERKTTPQLAAMNDLIIFPDVVTQSVATRYAVPSLISRRPLLTSDGKVAPSTGGRQLS